MIPYFYPATVFGGPVPIVNTLSRELARKGHKVSIYTTNAKDRKRNLKLERNIRCMDGFYVRYFKNIMRPYAFFFSPDIIRIAKREIPEFDLIHLHGYRTFQNVVVHYYAKKYDVPYVLQVHGSLPRIMAKQRLKCIFDVLFGCKLLRDASKVIALNSVEAKQYSGMGVPEEKIAVIPNGIDLPEHTALPSKGTFKKKFDIDEDEKILLYLGRIHKIKGIDILVEAFANVVEKLNHVKLKLLIVGPDDGYLSKVRTLIKTLKIDDNVLITGPLYGQDKLEAYVDAEAYVLPSRYEIWGMTVLEAVACGTPVILTEKCGITEYLKDTVGLVVKPESNLLCGALLEMLLDTDKQNTFRENCRSVAERFDTSKTVSKLEKVYEEIVDAKGHF